MSGIQLIATERQRQVKAEGYTPAHDDEHANGELALAAACYATFHTRASVTVQKLCWQEVSAEFAWPWARSDYKPRNDPILNLVKAGALIAAEIDRLQRACAAAPDGKDA